MLTLCVQSHSDTFPKINNVSEKSDCQVMFVRLFNPAAKNESI